MKYFLKKYNILLMERIKIIIPPEYDAKTNDYKNVELKKISFNISSKSYFKELSIDNFYDDSNLVKYLHNYVKENNIDLVDYDIFYKKGKEWYSTFILYKKNSLIN